MRIRISILAFAAALGGAAFAGMMPAIQLVSARMAETKSEESATVRN